MKIKTVFISHASDDPTWNKEAVCALATALYTAGVNVLLDDRHQENGDRKLSPDEWRIWMIGMGDRAPVVDAPCYKQQTADIYYDFYIERFKNGCTYAP